MAAATVTSVLWGVWLNPEQSQKVWDVLAADLITRHQMSPDDVNDPDVDRSSLIKHLQPSLSAAPPALSWTMVADDVDETWDDVFFTPGVSHGFGVLVMQKTPNHGNPKNLAAAITPTPSSQIQHVFAHHVKPILDRAQVRQEPSFLICTHLL